MSILNPTNLETADYGTVGWNAIYSSNFQKINDYLAKLQSAWDTSVAKSDGDILVYNSTTGKWENSKNISDFAQLDASNKISISNEVNEGIATVTANTTADDNYTTILVDATSSAITITLSATITGKKYTIKKIDSSTNVITVSTSSGTIDGQTSYTISNQYDRVSVIYDGTNYYII